MTSPASTQTCILTHILLSVRQLSQVMALGGRAPGRCEMGWTGHRVKTWAPAGGTTMWGVCHTMARGVSALTPSGRAHSLFVLLEVASVTNPTDQSLLLWSVTISSCQTLEFPPSVHQSWSGTLHPSTKEGTRAFLGFDCTFCLVLMGYQCFC